MDDSFFTGYRKTTLRPQEVLLSVEIPLSKKVETCHRSGSSTSGRISNVSVCLLQSQFVSAYKQSPRREDDISIVTAAMSVTFTPGSDVVEDLRLSYGGMAATTVLAKKTANRLLGR